MLSKLARSIQEYYNNGQIENNKWSYIMWGKAAPQGKNVVGPMCFADYMQTTFFYLGRFLKEIADDQCSSITI